MAGLVWAGLSRAGPGGVEWSRKGLSVKVRGLSWDTPGVVSRWFWDGFGVVSGEVRSWCWCILSVPGVILECAWLGVVGSGDGRVVVVFCPGVRSRGLGVVLGWSLDGLGMVSGSWGIWRWWPW